MVRAGQIAVDRNTSGDAGREGFCGGARMGMGVWHEPKDTEGLGDAPAEGQEPSSPNDDEVINRRESGNGSA